MMEDFGYFGDESLFGMEDDLYEQDPPMDPFEARMQAEQDAFDAEIDRQIQEWKDERAEARYQAQKELDTTAE